MRRQGVFRLWVVLTLIFVPAFAIWQFNDAQKSLEFSNGLAAKTCSDQEDRLPNFDYSKCLMQNVKTVFDVEQTTPRAYWGKAFGISFAVDLILTALLLGVYFVGRWVFRGFKPKPSQAT